MTRLIKKYKNRRLYDTKKSQYITVEDLQRYVLDGLPFQVEDSVTGNDITNTILLQIFVEMEAGASPFLSSDVLRHLIVLSNHPMHKTLKTWLEEMVVAMNSQLQANPYLKEYQQTTEQWQKNAERFITEWQDLFHK